MTNDHEQLLDTDAWYYTRMMFSRGRPGSLRLRRRRLSFVTVGDESRSSTFYESVDNVSETIFDLVVDDIDAISYNWLVGALTVTEEGRRHIISLAGPPSGGHFEDARRLITALTTLGRWRAHLQLQEPGEPAFPELGTTRGTQHRSAPTNGKLEQS